MATKRNLIESALRKNVVVYLKVNELAQFKPHEQNRIADKKHINELKDSILNCPIIPHIIVNPNTNTMIDGVHKTQAALELIEEGLLEKDFGFFVQYVPMKKEEEIFWIIELNNNTKGWTTDDYVHSYIPVSNSYALLEKFCKEHEICHNSKKNIYRYGASMMLGKNSYSCLKKGTFNITEEDYKFGQIFHNEIMSLMVVLGKELNGDFYAYISTPWKKVRERYTLSQWLKGAKRVKKRVNELSCRTKTDWATIFDVISSNVI